MSTDFPPTLQFAGIELSQLEPVLYITHFMFSRRGGRPSSSSSWARLAKLAANVITKIVCTLDENLFNNKHWYKQCRVSFSTRMEKEQPHVDEACLKQAGHKQWVS